MSYIAEKSVIGALLLEEESISEIYNIVNHEMFENELFGKVYLEFQRAYDMMYKLTLPMIVQKIEDELFTSEVIVKEMRSCLNEVYTTSHIRENANVILNSYKARRLKEIIKTIKVSPNDIKTQICSLQKELEALQENKEYGIKTLADITKEYKEKYFKEKENSLLYLGFEKIDEFLGGLEGGDVIVIGARPAVGKSALVTQIASNIAKKGKKIGFYNLEMQNKQIYERFLASESGIGITRLRSAVSFLGDENGKFEKANNELMKADNIVVISSGGKSANEIKSESKHMNYDVIMIDYLQLLKADTTYKGNRAAEVGEISRGVKNLAMELNIPVIALSQLNRVSESRTGKEPTMAELREAGNIEQDASVIILLWNIDEGNKKGCKIAKNRQGQCGKVVLKFDGNLMKFEETGENIEEASEWKKVEGKNPFI